MGIRGKQVSSPSTSQAKSPGGSKLRQSPETQMAVEADISSLRVIQETLVYITNLPECLSSSEVLSSFEYFGQYGLIQKCLVSKTKGKTTHNAYITYSTSEEATLCIKACNFFQLDNHILEVNQGTTRYCTYFLKNQLCPRTDCLFLHERRPGKEVYLKDTFNIRRQNSVFNNSMIDNMNYEFRTGHGTVLPQPRRLTDQEVTDKQLECESPSSPSKRKQSRFSFARGNDESSFKQQGNESSFTELAFTHSPSKNHAHLSSDQYEDIMSPSGRDKWAADLFHAIPLRKSFDVLKFGEYDDVYLVSQKSDN